MITDIRQILECPDCASPNIVHNMRRDQVICRECGLIYEPLTPKEEERFEKTHNLMPKPVRLKKVKKAVKRKAVKKKKATRAKKSRR